MYSSDKPIVRAEEDMLGRASFAKLLGQAIMSDFSTDNIVIGLFGKWGSGKTSIINIALKEVECISETKEDNKKPVILKFSPWNFTNSENLISQFFIELKSVLLPKGNSDAMAKVGELLETYSDAFDLLEHFPGGKIYAPLIKSGAKTVGEALQDKCAKKSIEETKRELEKALAEQEHRIIVIIDDIDRLTNDQIRTVFQLVKQVAGLPNMTYLLSMDREIVVRALETVQKCNGNEYLEKIVQIPFDIPQIDDDRVQKILFSNLDALLDEYPSGSFETNHWSRVYRYCVKPFIKSVRDVNRLTNVFRFKYSVLHSEVNFADLLGVTALGLYLPDFASWISINKQLLCNGVHEYHFLMHDNQKENDLFFCGIFEQLNVSKKQGYECLTALFPEVSKLTGQNIYAMGDETDQKLRKNLRLASPERFDLYFQLGLSQIPVSRDMIKQFAYEMGADEIRTLIYSLNAQNKVSFFLAEFQELISDIPKSRISLLISLLVEFKCSLKGEVQNTILATPAPRQAAHCIEQLFMAFDSKDNVFSLVCDIINSNSNESLSGITDFIYCQERAHGHLGTEHNSPEKQLVSEEQLIEIENLLIHRLEELSESGQLFSLKNLNYIAYLWNGTNYDSFCKHFKSQISKIENILYFITSFSGKWHSSASDKNEGWSIYYSSVKDYIDPSINVYDEIRQIDKRKLLNEYNSDDLEKIATFLLNEGKNDDINVEASIEEARQLIDAWRNEKS